jgi:hypothetical protein
VRRSTIAARSLRLTARRAASAGCLVAGVARPARRRTPLRFAPRVAARQRPVDAETARRKGGAAPAPTETGNRNESSTPESPRVSPARGAPIRQRATIFRRIRHMFPDPAHFRHFPKLSCLPRKPGLEFAGLVEKLTVRRTQRGFPRTGRLDLSGRVHGVQPPGRGRCRLRWGSFRRVRL